MSEEILDGKSTIELNLDKELLFDLMLMAHERDITLNQLIEEALRLFIEEHEKNKWTGLYTYWYSALPMPLAMTMVVTMPM